MPMFTELDPWRDEDYWPKNLEEWGVLGDEVVTADPSSPKIPVTVSRESFPPADWQTRMVAEVVAPGGIEPPRHSGLESPISSNFAQEASE